MSLSPETRCLISIKRQCVRVPAHAFKSQSKLCGFKTTLSSCCLQREVTSSCVRILYQLEMHLASWNRKPNIQWLIQMDISFLFYFRKSRFMNFRVGMMAPQCHQGLRLLLSFHSALFSVCLSPHGYKLACPPPALRQVQGKKERMGKKQKEIAA